MADLDEKIEKYCELKEQEKKVSKDIKILNAEIKEYLLGTDDKKQNVGDWEVHLQHKTNEDIDEEKLLSVIKAWWEREHEGEACPYIAKVEVADMDELERGIYNKRIPDEVLMLIDKCRIKKETDNLIYSKVKKGD